MPRTYDRALRAFAATRAGGWLVLNVLTHLDRWLIRVSRGRLSSGIGSGLHDAGIVLRTTGARSGKLRDVPLVAFRRGDDFVVIASATGQQKNPAWYYNLVAHPDAEVLASGVRHTVRARLAEGGERDDLWASAVSLYEGFDVYRRRTDRRIPVFVLEPR